MKHLVLFLTVFASSAVGQAELVIDDFTLPTLNGALDDDIAGTRTITTTGSATATVDGVGGVIFTGGLLGGSRIDILYTFTTPFNMSDPSLAFKTLVVDLFDTVTGTFSLQAFFTNSAAMQSNLGPIAITSPGARGFNDTSLPASIATDVKSIQLRLTRQTNGAVITSSGSLVAATPEPASLALLGMTGLGGWFVARRRAKKTETVA